MVTQLFMFQDGEVIKNNSPFRTIKKGKVFNLNTDFEIVGYKIYNQ